MELQNEISRNSNLTVTLHLVHDEGVEVTRGDGPGVHLEPHHVPGVESDQAGGGAAAARPGRAARHLVAGARTRH